MPEQTRIHEEHMEEDEAARASDTERPGRTEGTLPGSMEGAAPGEMLGNPSHPIDPEQRMRELEAARGEGSPGAIGDTVINTPAGRMEPGRSTRPEQPAQQAQDGDQRGQHKDRQPENNVANRSS